MAMALIQKSKTMFWKFQS